MSRESSFFKALSVLLKEYKVDICIFEMDEAHNEIVFQFHERRDNKSHRVTNYHTKRMHFSAYEAEGRSKLK